MTDNELLSAIANMMNKNSKAMEYQMQSLNDKIDGVESRLNDKIDGVEKRLDSKIDSVEKRLDSKIDSVEKRLDSKIDSVEKHLDSKIDGVESRLSNEIHKINLKLENDIEPRLQNIEDCYISTYDRYKVEVERMDKMQMDIEVLQDVVKEHGEAIMVLTA